MSVKTGIGWDVHPLEAGRKLVLGGVHFKQAKKGLTGHSDADVVCHAICDAILGALAWGDIGEKFPETDPQYRNFPSIRFLEMVGGMIKESKYQISNIDCTVMSDEVLLGENKKVMSEKIAHSLGLLRENVCVKATRWEGHGAVGRGEVIACLAIATITRPE